MSRDGQDKEEFEISNLKFEMKYDARKDSRARFNLPALYRLPSV
jgi:hypothetical protein